MDKIPNKASTFAWQKEFLERHKLSARYLDDVQQWGVQLAEWIITLQKGATPYFLLGINGCQGSGKTTLCNYLANLLREDYGIATLELSLDDFYLPLEKRRQLAQEVHPLLLTRGAPGTHDISLLREVLAQLGCPEAYPLALPRFDKSTDDRMPTSQWRHLDSAPRVVLLEGWCLGAQPAADEALTTNINELEANEDPDLTWRRYANHALQDFLPLYDAIDRWIMLAAPSFDCVFSWRQEQENKLSQRHPNSKGVMNEAQLRRFVAHYQRVTESCLRDLPERVDCVFKLNSDREIESAQWKEQVSA